MPTISQGELDRVKNKQGVYSQLNKSIKVGQSQKEINNLITTVVDIVEKSFKAYAKSHGCKDSMLEVEWNRMKRFLLKNL